MNSPAVKRPLWLRLLRALAVFVVVMVALVFARFLWVTRDRKPGYAVALNVSTAAAVKEPRPLRAGFGRRSINPDLSRPDEPVWLAGFSQGRAATNIHDNLQAIAIAIDDGHHRLGIVVLDAIGFFHDDVVSVRERIGSEHKLDYVVVCATHNHSTPDLMGLWGPNYAKSGVNARYRALVIESAAAAMIDAVKALQPARMQVHEIVTPPDGLVADTRRPEVFDPDIRVLHFLAATNDATIGTLVGWANHPETPWSRNQDITADFPGVIREALETGIVYDGKTMVPGLGGISVYVNGAVGGLMSTTPSVTVHDPFLKTEFKTPSHDKTRALGNNLAARILERIRSTNAPAASTVALGIEARSIELPLVNKGFVAASMLGLIDRGHSAWMKIRTEVALIRLGDVSMICIPGEVYPEIVNGGIIRAPGGDHDIDPLEIPPLRQLMPGKTKFVLGLANDEIGYIIPKSEWDTEPPHLFGADHAPYGEINSLGPDTAWLLHSALRRLCEAAK